MAEMKCLISSIYRQYSTALSPEMDGYAPGITSRFEVFYDTTVGNVKVGLRFAYMHDTYTRKGT
jgi:hypothetical protein